MSGTWYRAWNGQYAHFFTRVGRTLKQEESLTACGKKGLVARTHDIYHYASKGNCKACEAAIAKAAVVQKADTPLVMEIKVSP